jgi:hypothetical protein
MSSAWIGRYRLPIEPIITCFDDRIGRECSEKSACHSDISDLRLWSEDSTRYRPIRLYRESREPDRWTDPLSYDPSSSSSAILDLSDITREFSSRELLLRDDPPEDEHPLEYEEKEKCSSHKEGDESPFGGVEGGEHEMSIARKEGETSNQRQSAVIRVDSFFVILTKRRREFLPYSPAGK